MRMPDFFIIGAPKCGTTSMAKWLRQHREIYVPEVKEPHYFNTDLDYLNIRNWDEYTRLFAGAEEHHKAVGEASVFYLYSQEAVPRIEREIGPARYIVMLRNPVRMARSLHEQKVFSQNEHIADFSRAWELSETRRRGDGVSPLCTDPRVLDYKRVCSLGEQLAGLYRRIPTDRVLTVVLDDVKENARREYLRVLNFLGVPDDGRRAFPAHNRAKRRRSKTLARLWKMARTVKDRLGLPRMNTGILDRLDSANRKNHRRAPLQPEMTEKLTNYFAEDVRALESLLGRDLSHWLDEQSSVAVDHK